MPGALDGAGHWLPAGAGIAGWTRVQQMQQLNASRCGNYRTVTVVDDDTLGLTASAHGRASRGG